MTTNPRPPAGTGPGTPVRRHRRTVLVAVAAVLAAVLLGSVIGLAGGGDDSSPAASSTPTPSAGTGPVPDAAATTASPDGGAGADEADPAGEEGGAEPVAAPGEELPPTLPEVSLDASATPDDGVVLRIAGVESIQGAAEGPGNVAGPAVRVTIRVENTTGEPVALDGVAVNAFHGEDRSPSSPLDDRSRQPFVGELPEGESAEGVYVFSVPEEAQDRFVVEVGYRAGAPRAVFAGPVP